jgi:hypothetical protein
MMTEADRASDQGADHRRIPEQFDLQIAINGDGFTPWWSCGPLDYYPHEGDLVTPNGVVSEGKLYSMDSWMKSVSSRPLHQPPQRVDFQ